MTDFAPIPAVIHNRSAQRFELRVEQRLARLDYLLQGQTILFTHTEVPPELEGRGLGSRLAQAGLAYASEQGYKVRTTCWFIAGYLQRHPEYQSLRAD